MSLSKAEAGWICRFTGGAIDPPYTLGQDETDDDDESSAFKNNLRALQDKQAVKERALKDKLIRDALAEIDARREELRDSTQFEATRVGKKETQQARPDDGRQASKKALEIAQPTGTISGLKFSGMDKFVDPKSKEAGKRIHKMETALRELQDHVVANLGNVECERWREPKDKKPPLKPVLVKEKLFTEEEIAEEIYTPLVRDKTIAETFVPPQYSKTQKMLDGSDDFYIKECRERGKDKEPNNRRALVAGVANLAANIATTFVTGASTPEDPTVGLASGLAPTEFVSNAWAPLTAEQATEGNTIINGIVATLNASYEAKDLVQDWVKGRTFDQGKLIDALDTIGKGVTALFVTEFQNASSSGGDAGEEKVLATGALVDFAAHNIKAVAQWAQWAKDPVSPPPWDALIDEVGAVLGAACTYPSDSLPGTHVDDNWADAGSAISAAFTTAAKAVRTKAFTAVKKGEWNTVFGLIETSARQAVNASIQVNFSNYNINASNDDTQYVLENQYQGDLNDAVSATMGAAVDVGSIAIPSGKGSKAEQEKQQMRERAKQLILDASKAKQQQDAEEVKSIQQQLEEEQTSYQTMLKSLGSKEPDESEYKSIAKLIERIEQDQAIWKGLTALFGGGIGIASGVTEAIQTTAYAVAAPLRAAGQLVKFIANLNAAADRQIAFEKWQEAQKDAIVAVSPYATSIQRFMASQERQMWHYRVQAAANATNALLVAGEMTPLMPAFKAASGAVTAAATLEDLLYTFMKQAELRKAWNKTKQAIDPANRADRKMRLLARKINPTLAKYTIAYGAVVEQDPIAIAAMSQVGLDRETLARPSSGVNEVRSYLEKLYPDDGSVLVSMAMESGATIKLPTVQLTSKAWALTYAVFKKEANLASANPPAIVGNLALYEKQSSVIDKRKPYESDGTEKDKDAKYDDQTQLYAEQTKLLTIATTLAGAFAVFQPLGPDGELLEPVKEAVGVYADMAAAEVARLKIEIVPPVKPAKLGTPVQAN
jgi:hypothetical protein